VFPQLLKISPRARPLLYVSRNNQHSSISDVPATSALTSPTRPHYPRLTAPAQGIAYQRLLLSVTAPPHGSDNRSPLSWNDLVAHFSRSNFRCMLASVGILVLFREVWLTAVRAASYIKVGPLFTREYFIPRSPLGSVCLQDRFHSFPPQSGSLSTETRETLRRKSRYPSLLARVLSPPEKILSLT